MSDPCYEVMLWNITMAGISALVIAIMIQALVTVLLEITC